jgi:hypothetical protein
MRVIRASAYAGDGVLGHVAVAAVQLQAGVDRTALELGAPPLRFGGVAVGVEDVFSRLAAARAHYEAVGLGADYCDRFVR